MGQETVEGEESEVKRGLLDLPVEFALDLQVVGEQWLKTISKAGPDGGSSLATPLPLALIRMLPQRPPHVSASRRQCTRPDSSVRLSGIPFCLHR